MKKCLTSLAMRKIQVKTTVSYHFTKLESLSPERKKSVAARLREHHRRGDGKTMRARGHKCCPVP